MENVESELVDSIAAEVEVSCHGNDSNGKEHQENSQDSAECLELDPGHDSDLSSSSFGESDTDDYLETDFSANETENSPEKVKIVPNRVENFINFHPCLFCTLSFLNYADLENHTKSHKEQAALRKISKKSPKSEEHIKIPNEQTLTDKFLTDISSSEQNSKLPKQEEPNVNNEQKINTGGRRARKRIPPKRFTLEQEFVQYISDDDLLTKKKSVKTKSSIPQKIYRNGKYKCEHCPNTFDSKSALQKHGLLHNFCDICGKDFKTPKYLRDHKKRHTKERPWKCEHCPKTYKTVRDLRLHIKTHTGERDLFCSICSKGFVYHNCLKSHMETHNSVRFQCDLCDKDFGSLNTLKEHKYTHTGQRPFKCKICSKGFSKRSILTFHITTHSGLKPYICHLCDASYTSKSSLYTHLKSHCGEKPHSCLYCDKRFLRKNALERHIRTHTGEKPFQCIRCCKMFSRKDYLSRHKCGV